MDLMNWYALQVVGGREKSVLRRVNEALERSPVSSAVSQVLVPTETVVEMKSGQRSERQQLLLPGYIIVEADWPTAATELLGVKGIITVLGGVANPAPMPSAQVETLLGLKSKQGPASRAPVAVGDTVRISAGPLSDFEGLVSEVDDRTQQATVQVEIFGRSTPAQISWRDLSLPK
jgi:transcriptional antiterminator NusG